MKPLLIIFLTWGIGEALLTNKITKNEELVKHMFDAFNRHEWTEVSNHYSDPADFLDPTFGTEYISRSKQEIRKHYAELEDIFPDIKDNIISIVASGNRVVVEFVSTGMSRDGIKMKLPICSVFTLVEGKIVRDATYYDRFNN